MPGQVPEKKRARKSQKGQGSDSKLTSIATTDDTTGEEDWAAVMQAEVCATSKMHPTKGTLGKK